MEPGTGAGEEWEVRVERPLRGSGNSIVLSIPPAILQEMQLKEGDTLEIAASRDRGKITLTPVEE